MSNGCTRPFLKETADGGYKGLPQGLVLSPFLYNIIGSFADRCIPSGCGFLQNADDLVVYMAHRLFNVARELVQTGCTSLNVFFSTMGLTISRKPADTCFTNMAKTHMLGLERVQYRALRNALGLIGSTPINCLGVLGGIPYHHLWKDSHT
jgi:hypothetical protein